MGRKGFLEAACSTRSRIRWCGSMACASGSAMPNILLSKPCHDFHWLWGKKAQGIRGQGLQAENEAAPASVPAGTPCKKSLFLQQKGPPTKRGQHVTSAPCNLPTRAVMHLARHRGVGIVVQVDVPSFNGDCRDHVKPCTEHSPIPPSTSDFGTLSITKRSPTQFPLDPQQKASSFSGRCSFVPLP